MARRRSKRSGVSGRAPSMAGRWQRQNLQLSNPNLFPQNYNLRTPMMITLMTFCLLFHLLMPWQQRHDMSLLPIQ